MSLTDEDKSAEHASISSDSLFVVACSCVKTYKWRRLQSPNKTNPKEEDVHNQRIEKHTFQVVLALVLSLMISLAQIALMLRLFYSNFNTYYPGFATASIGCVSTNFQSCTDQKCQELIETTITADHINSSYFGSFCVNYTSNMTGNDDVRGIGCCDCSPVWDPTTIPTAWRIDHESIQNEECHALLCSGILNWQGEDLWGLVPLILIVVSAAVSKDVGELLLCHHILQLRVEGKMLFIEKTANFVMLCVVWMQLHVVHFFVIINTIHLILLSKDALSFLSNAIAIVFVLEADNCCAQFLFEKDFETKISFLENTKFTFAKRIAFITSCLSTYIFLHVVLGTNCSRESSAFTYNTSVFLGFFQVYYPLIMHKIFFQTSELWSDTSKYPLKGAVMAPPDKCFLILRLWIHETCNVLFFDCIFLWHSALISLWASFMVSNQNWFFIPRIYGGYEGNMVFFILENLSTAIYFWVINSLLFCALSFFCNVLGIAIISFMLIIMTCFPSKTPQQVHSVDLISKVQPSDAAKECVKPTGEPCHYDVQCVGSEADEADLMAVEDLASVSAMKARCMQGPFDGSELLASPSESDLMNTGDPNLLSDINQDSCENFHHVLNQPYDILTVESFCPPSSGNGDAEIMPVPNINETEYCPRGKTFTLKQQKNLESLGMRCSETGCKDQAIKSNYNQSDIEILSSDSETEWLRTSKHQIPDNDYGYIFQDSITNVIYAGCLMIPPLFASVYVFASPYSDFAGSAQDSGWYWILPKDLVAGFLSWFSKFSCKCLLSKYPVDCNRENTDCKISSDVSVVYKCFNGFEETIEINGTSDYMSFGTITEFMCVGVYDSQTGTMTCDTSKGTNVNILICSLFLLPILTIFLESKYFFIASVTGRVVSIFFTRLNNNKIEGTCSSKSSSKNKLRANLVNASYLTFTIMMVICVLFIKFFEGGECGMLQDDINPQDFQGN